MNDRAPDKGTEHVNVVTNEIWTESPVCLTAWRIKPEQG